MQIKEKCKTASSSNSHLLFIFHRPPPLSFFPSLTHLFVPCFAFLFQCSVGKLGNIQAVAKMIPGIAGKIDPKSYAMAEKKMKRSEHIISYMTAKERKNPDLLMTDSTARLRVTRIAEASETSIP
jgi:hypothetical protein